MERSNMNTDECYVLTGIYQAMTLCSCPMTTGCMMEVTAGPSIEYCGATPSTTFTAQVVPGTSAAHQDLLFMVKRSYWFIYVSDKG
ncbi:MAG: hypothetical protein IPH96_17690 [Saprospiraceae bacterium]|nr:hypothetical protein [Saprospiraceae bacterium]